MPWLQARLTIEKKRAPLVERLFGELGALSVTLEDAADEPLLEPLPGESPLWQQTRVTGLFAADADPQLLRTGIHAGLGGDIAGSLLLEPLQDQVWERAWLKDFRPTRFGNRLWICPDGQRPDAKEGIFIDLDPGLAFGTGTHPSTALCLTWLDHQYLTGKRVLDFGCGSGILSIAALKLGASQVIAVDHDHQALLATEENARKNGIVERLAISHSGNLPDQRVDIVLANILAGTLIGLEPRLAAAVRRGGEIVLSGILADQQEMVSRAFAQHFALRPPRTLEGWLLLEGERRENPSRG